MNVDLMCDQKTNNPNKNMNTMVNDNCLNIKILPDLRVDIQFLNKFADIAFFSIIVVFCLKI
ncbi:hypothetical protein PCK1_001506 [Pneumocystis canis]|nr:hypothetical protein PCK1_001506 [Pneumocystis canis]